MVESPTRVQLPRRGAGDATWAAAAWGAALLVACGFLWLAGDVFRHGLPRLSWSFLVSPPAMAGREGGVGPVLVSTAWILGVCLAAVLPLGMGTAILLAEFTASATRLGRAVRWSLDVLAGVPSIVFGLFGNAFFCVFLGLGFSILSGGLTLACMVLPLFIRSAEEGLRAVQPDMRLAAAALGMSRWSALVRIVLPAAAPGLAVALVLSIGRALAETAALLFTSGYVSRMPASVFDSGRTLSIHIYDLAMNIAGGESYAYATAAVLILLLLVINTAATRLAHGSGLRRFAG